MQKHTKFSYKPKHSITDVILNIFFDIKYDVNKSFENAYYDPNDAKICDIHSELTDNLIKLILYKKIDMHYRYNQNIINVIQDRINKLNQTNTLYKIKYDRIFNKLNIYIRPYKNKPYYFKNEYIYKIKI